ncbi:hypothetical protein [Nocardiopsis sp. ATB16-24]|uniref:hypothetical protein n=1 Tax=Nocardiopsis sp. ATB16-24 TaxID=3019555 RepID=UPI002552A105|nr:hypothetical protein [Nocardiopsis sp. ATB16-24]
MTVAFDDEPEQPHVWTDRGFTAPDARRWIGAGFTVEEAVRWREAGVYRPRPAQAWRTAGVTPRTLRPLLRAGMTPRDAVRWHEFGYSRAEAVERHLAGEHPRPRRPWRTLLPVRRSRGLDLSDAQAEFMDALLSIGVPATTARAYLDAGWRREEAALWAHSGVDPVRAGVYRALGFSAREGSAPARDGREALDLLCQWWDAGVPRGEVAAWVRAGLGPAAAARARAEGSGPPTV